MVKAIVSSHNFYANWSSKQPGNSRHIRGHFGPAEDLVFILNFTPDVRDALEKQKV
jgi:hypothetical protein